VSRRGATLTEACLALLVLGIGLVPLWAMLRGARHQVGDARAQLVLRVRAFEALDEGRRMLLEGRLPARAGAVEVLDTGNATCFLRLARDEAPGSPWVLAVRAESEELAYELEAVVAGPLGGAR
jgi:hypothetical protein